MNRKNQFIYATVIAIMISAIILHFIFRPSEGEYKTVKYKNPYGDVFYKIERFGGNELSSNKTWREFKQKYKSEDLAQIAIDSMKRTDFVRSY